MSQPLFADPPPPEGGAPWRHRAYETIFEATTPAGRTFDLVLILTILGSVGAVMLESVAPIRAEYGPLLRRIEAVFTLVFTIEYAVRLAIVQHPLRYARSFFGAIDLLAVLPFYLSLFIPGAQYLTIVRLVRILRVFRILKLARYLQEASTLTRALQASSRKIAVFIATVVTLVTILGSVMYVVEGGKNGFTSIPMSVYWAVVTLTTVGYGDISPVTPAGRFVATLIMLLGYGILAVPTGIVTVEIANASRPPVSLRRCPRHPEITHDADSGFCRLCGTPLADTLPPPPAPSAGAPSA